MGGCFRHEVRDVLRLLGAQLVVNQELALRGLEPLLRVTFQDDSEAPLRVRVKPLERIQALREPAEKHLLDAADLDHRLAKVVRCLAGHNRVVARLQFCEASADLHLVAGRLLPEVSQHLRVNFARDQAAVAVEHADGLGFRQVRLKMPNHLPGQLVEQLGVSEVVDVIEVHQRVHDVVLKPRFL